MTTAPKPVPANGGLMSISRQPSENSYQPLSTKPANNDTWRDALHDLETTIETAHIFFETIKQEDRDAQLAQIACEEGKQS